MSSKKIIGICLILATVVALPFINRAVFGTAQKEVSVASISERVISPSILASGFLAHEQEVMLSSEVIGRVDKLYVEEGDSVTAGQLVL
jgi:HlyD family secretion protein